MFPIEIELAFSEITVCHSNSTAAKFLLNVRVALLAPVRLWEGYTWYKAKFGSQTTEG